MADTSNRIGGVLSFIAGGEPLELGGQCSLAPQLFARKSVTGITGPAGSTREGVIPFVEVETFYKGNVRLDTLHGLEGVDVQVNLDNGHSFVLTGARQVGVIELDAAEGTFTLRFEGNGCDEQ